MILSLLTSSLRVILGFAFLLSPGFLLSKATFSSQHWSLLARSFFGIIFSLTTLPLLIFELFYFGHLQITPTLFLVVNVLVLFIISVSLYLRGHFYFDFKTKSIVQLSSLLHSRIPFLVVLLVGTFIITFPTFIKHQPLPGPDSPVYLYNSAVTFATHQIPRNLDRSVVYLIPVLITYSTGLSIYLSLKLLAVTLYLLSGISVYLLARNFFSPSLSAVAMLIAFIDQGLLGLSLHIFAFEFAIIIANVVLMILLKLYPQPPRHLAHTLLLTSWFWGLLFNLHGIVAFGSLLFIGLPIGFYLYSHRRTLITSRRYTISLLVICTFIFIISSVPLFYRGWKFVYRGWFMPVTGIGMDQPIPPPNQNINGPIRSAIINSASHQLQLPALWQYFFTMHSTPIILASIFGLVYVCYLLNKSTPKPQTHLLLLASTLGYFILTQQQLIGVDWFSGRFIMAMYPSIIILAIYGLDSISRLVHLPQNLLRLPVLTQTPVLLLLSTPLLVYSYTFWQTQYVAFIKPQDFNFYQQLPQLIDSNYPHTIFYSGTDQNWLIGLNPNLNIFAIDNLHICNPQYNNIGTKQWQTTDAFCDNTSLKDSITNLTKYGGDPHYYVIIQAASSTADLSKFTNGHYRRLSDQNNLYLFQLL